MSVPRSIIASPVPSTAATVQQEFLRACGHRQRMLHTLGDTAQAARYEATACAGCREPVITFDRGWGR